MPQLRWYDSSIKDGLSREDMEGKQLRIYVDRLATVTNNQALTPFVVAKSVSYHSAARDGLFYTARPFSSMTTLAHCRVYRQRQISQIQILQFTRLAWIF